MKYISITILVAVLCLISAIPFSAQVAAGGMQDGDRLAFGLYARQAAAKENIFFSPFSVTTAVGMAYEGARGKTADEMRAVLGFSENVIERRNRTKDFIDRINSTGKEYEIETANALWVDKVYTILPDYLDLVSKYYNGEAKSIDLTGSSEKSRVVINRWVAGHTRNRIKELVPPNMITAMTRLVITNAIYFKGKWAVPFVTKLTERETFHINSQSQVEAEMMRLPQARLDYAEDEDAKVLRMDYVGHEMAMLIILPKENNIKALEDRLDDRQFLRWLGSVRLTDVMVIMPRFKFETEYQLQDDLAGLGMTTAFLPGRADFSGMTGNHDLSVGSVIQKAWIEVNEEGSEATAATALMFLSGGSAKFEKPKPKMFCADHPFIFFIYDRESKRILFMGRVMDPTKS